jgi:hypothetical protein
MVVTVKLLPQSQNEDGRAGLVAEKLTRTAPVSHTKMRRNEMIYISVRHSTKREGGTRDTVDSGFSTRLT